MENLLNNKNNADIIQARLKYLEEVNRSTFGALDQVVELVHELLRVQINQDPAMVCEEAKKHLKRLMSFRALAFLKVNEVDFDFQITLCDPESDRVLLNKEIDDRIGDGTFAWALKQSNAVLVPARFFGKQTLVFHPLASKSQVIGMFIGILRGTGLSIEDISTNLLSIILLSCAQAIENSMLYSKAEQRAEELKILNKKLRREINERKMAEKALKAAKDELEVLVEKRTFELAKANDALKAEIEERKHAEEKKAKLLNEVESINQELKDFAYVVSHDLKAPLRGIRTLTEWISLDYKDKLGEDGQKQLDLLISRVQRMHDLIEGILQYSRVGRIKEEKVTVDLNLLVQEIIEMIDPPKNISVEVAKRLPTIQFERTRIGQVFQNLIVNAVKYMDKPKGNVTIGCAPENGYWKFNVTDNGPGIDRKHFNRIFQLFQTLKSSDNLESTGVGLTLVKKIIEIYGGDIWVESEIGKGSTFYFRLPRGKNDKY